MSAAGEASSQICLVLCTATCVEAEPLARRLLEARLIACANLLGPAKSLYWWQGKIDSSEETLMLLKTRRQVLAELRSKLVEWHSYEIPEFLVFDVDSGLPAYLSWIEGEVVDHS